MICVNVGDRYGNEWVYRLKRMVNKHLDYDEFVCMTDHVIHGIQRKQAPDLPGWWSKVGLFRPGLFPGENLYLDLDVVITDSLQPIVDAFREDKSKVWARDDFSYSLRNPKTGLGEHMQTLLGGSGTVNSSVLLWEGDTGRDVWDKFKPEKMDEVHGDQNWITQALWPDKLALLPDDLICSYKYHVQRGCDPSNVVIFHGDPKVTELSKRDPLRVIWDTDSLIASH